MLLGKRRGMGEVGWGGGRWRETQALNTGQEKWEEEGGRGRKTREEGNVSPARLWELRGRLVCGLRAERT